VVIEERKTLFVLPSSSARSLRRKGTNLLAGRALTFRMHPLSWRELGTEAELATSLSSGHLPAALAAPDPRAFPKSYVQAYLREEVQQEGFARSVGAFSRFLEAASFSQASLLNVAEAARECAAERKTASGYFQGLEDLPLASTVPVFRRRARRRLAAHSKFYYFDVGLYRALRPAGPLDRPEEIEGACLESLVYQEIRALNDYLGFAYELFFWRTATGAEVDFVAYGESGILAIEVKRSRRLAKTDLAGMSLFRSDYPSPRCVVLYGGERHQYQEGIELIPLKEGLQDLAETLRDPSPAR
jgi:predicted AAA+ superfamily ATPase